MLGIDIPLDTGDFRLMSRPRGADAARAARAAPLRARHGRLGRLQADRGHLRPRRRASPARPSTRCARCSASRIDGITSFSTVPLRFATWLGVLRGLVAIGVGAWAVYVKLFGSGAVPGWTTIMILVALGVVGAAADDRHPRRVHRAHLRGGEAAPSLVPFQDELSLATAGGPGISPVA